MAELVKLPLANLIRIPEGLSELTGALVEPLAVAVHAVSRVPLEDVRTVIVIGGGPIGLLTALVARSRGVPNVFVSEILPSRVALAQKLGLKAVTQGTELTALVE